MQMLSMGICTFDVYCRGNSTNAPSPNGVVYGVVFKLIEPCLQKGYTVYMDNYYSSLLFRNLLAAGVLIGKTFLNVSSKNLDLYQEVPVNLLTIIT